MFRLKYESLLSLTILSIIITSLGWISSLYAQDYDSILKMEVIYYDFHSDRSNPEFEVRHNSSSKNRNGLVKNMVLDTLLDSVPTYNPAVGCLGLNKYINKWFKKWERGDSTRPNYTPRELNQWRGPNNGGLNWSWETLHDQNNPFIPYSDTLTKCGSPEYETLNHDTAFINQVFKDSLIFTHIGNGRYRFTNSAFFPLRNRGFYRDWNFANVPNNNYSFTMKMHMEFTKLPNMTFSFTGDDDLWVFVNKKLAMDLGGIHSPQSDSFNLNTFRHLDDGKRYSLDLFYAERHSDASNIQITTNMFTPHIRDFHIEGPQNRTMVAGNIDTLIAAVYDDFGYREDWSDNITWKIIANGRGANLVPSGTDHDSIAYLTDTVAYNTVWIEATISVGNEEKHDTVYVYVLPNRADHLVIERICPPPQSDLNRNAPINPIVIPSDSTHAYAHAVLRDRYQNYVSASTNTRWTIEPASPDTNILSNIEVSNAGTGQGRINKKANVTRDTADISAVDNGTGFSANTRVVVDDVNYDDLRILINIHGRDSVLSSLTTNTDDTTILISQAHRRDGLGGNNGWTIVRSNWSSVLNNNIARRMVQNDTSDWHYNPNDTGRGIITASFRGLNDTIAVIVNHGAPDSIEIYPDATSSQPYNAPPSQITAPAGNRLPLYAKLFDSRGVEITLGDSIRWDTTLVGGFHAPIGNLSGLRGHPNAFTPFSAENLLYIRARYSNTISDRILVHTVAGRPYRLTIHSDTTGIAYAADVDAITMSASDREQHMFVVVRDSFYNFIDYAERSIWESRDPTIANAAAGLKIFRGEGVITRATDSTRNVRVDAFSNDRLFRDSLLVRISNITYDSVQIYSVVNGRKRIDTISVRTDDSLRLYAEGKRSDTHEWQDIQAFWFKSNNLRVRTLPLLIRTPSWNVRPESIGIGKIWITDSSRAGRPISDTITAFFLPGLPYTLSLYNKLGHPDTVPKCPDIDKLDTIIAGKTYPIFTKIFDKNKVWLSTYEDPNRTRKLISWSIKKIRGPAPTAEPLNSEITNSTSFTPTIAYTYYDIISVFNETGLPPLSDTVRVYVAPDTVHQLVIEGSNEYDSSSIYMVRPNPLANVQFQESEKSKYVYAVLRDRFGNYVTKSKSTEWSSLDTAVVNAYAGIQSLGQGIIYRKVPLDTALVVARYTVKNLRDTVPVYLSNFSYRDLRIVVQDTIKIDTLIMRNDQDTLLLSQGLRSYDSVWVNVEVDWEFKLNNSSTSSKNFKSKEWLFSSKDTGTGLITITNDTLKKSIFVKILPGLPIRLRLYASEDSPTDFPKYLSDNNIAYPEPLIAINAIAGIPFPLAGKLFDSTNLWLQSLERINADSITWTVQELNNSDTTGKIIKDRGLVNSYIPIKARRNVKIIARYNQRNGNVLSDTILLYTIPGEPKNLFLEGTSDLKASPYKPNPLDTLRIPITSRQEPIYAILRDSCGNFVRYANVIQWGTAFNDTNVSASDGNRAIGEGIVRSKLAGIDTVFAVDSLGFRDSVIANVLGFYYTHLRILSRGDTINSLTMSTNLDTTLTVQGLRSDNQRWDNISANWENSRSLDSCIRSPGNSPRWLVSPRDTGTGWIRVHLENSTITVPDTIAVKFTPGAPLRAEIKILTPENKRIAGQPIDCQVTIYNGDNKTVQGSYCFNPLTGEPVKYSDILKPRNGFTPYIIVDDKKLLLSENGSQCFESGVDTVKLTLFYAPVGTDTLHQITANLGSLVAKTEKFKLYPGPLDTLVLENSSGKPIDTLKLRYPQGARIYAIGYDEYSNRIGQELSNWSTDSTLHAVEGGLKVSNIFYDASSVRQNESGRLTAISTAFPAIKASVPVIILGPPFTMVAITRDDDGNGYLDHIEIRFSRQVTIPKNSIFANNFKVKYGFAFTVDSIENNVGRTDSVWRLALHENRTDEPQTNWKPIVTIDEIPSLGIEADTVTALDGAGPVIWRVVKKVVDVNNNNLDIVTITLSEPIVRNPDLVRLSSSDKPISIFNVYESHTDGTFKPVNGILDGISGLFETNKDSIFTFMTTNKQEITGKHYFNLKWEDSTKYVVDKVTPPNSPQRENRKVQCIVTGDVGTPLSVPNPSVPTPNRRPPGTFEADHNPEALDWLKTDRAGFGIIFPITLTDSLMQKVKIKYIIKIYDFVGNIVVQSIVPDLIQSVINSRQNISSNNVTRGQTIKIVSYWNGYSKDGMKATPGLYKAVVIQRNTWRGSDKPPKDFVPEREESIIIGVNSGNYSNKKK
jgi:fibro-slime domain-containing protein